MYDTAILSGARSREVCKQTTEAICFDIQEGENRLNALGTHLLLDLKDCQAECLNDVEHIRTMMVTAAKMAKATIIDNRFHQFSPFGVSGVIIIAESHMSIHTWPEYRYAAVDLFTCGQSIQSDVAAHYLIDQLQARQPSLVEIKRGMLAWEGGPLPHKPNSCDQEEEGNLHGRSEELQMVL